ncbi:hypothetical protein ACFT5B_02715 [Luteimicrobium sp. NPDC057192]|uniref:restriction system modified-DNA reader domain-containing protein n=1 Tax=Luteimicrobium sp. NPDC057192 TaxID=3346042 RepID=UPI00364065CA
MPLFEVDARRSALVQPLAPGDTSFIRTAEPVVDDHVSRLLGEQIFPVVSRAPGARPEDAPHLLALDAAGHPVVIEMVARLDAASLALALAHAGRAGRLTLSDVAARFPEGLPAFEAAYDEFRRKAPIARTRGQREGSRLLLLCAQVDPGVTDALDFLRVTNRAVTVLRLGVVTGPDGRRLVEVEPLHGARRPTESSDERAQAAPSAPAPAASDDDDLADATMIRPALRRPVVSPTSVTGTTATATASSGASAPVEPASAQRSSAPERVSALPERSALSDRYGLPNRRSFSTTEQLPPTTGGAAAATNDQPATATGAGPTRVSMRAANRAAAAPATPVPPPPVLSRPPVEDDLPRTRSAARAASAAQATPAGPPVGSTANEADAAPGPTDATPLPSRRSRAERRRAAEGSAAQTGADNRPPAPAEPAPAPLPGAGVVPLSDARSAHPTDYTTAPLDTSLHRASTPLTLSGPLSSELPVPSPQLPLHGDPADEDPDLFMLAQHLGAPTPLVWSRPRRGERFEAVLHPEGQIELPGTGRYRNPDAAATAAVGSRREDGWDVWRLGDAGPSLTDLFREQFA